MTIDLAALVARAQLAASANLVPVKRNASTGRVERVASAPVKVQPVAPVAAPRAMTADDARAFIAAVRAAGKRPNDKGVMVSAGDAVKLADEKAALVAFMGRADAPHGNAMFQASNKAKLLIASEGATYRPEPAKVSPTLRGYTAGVNDAAKRAADDAAARRRVIVALVLDLRKVTTRDAFAAALVAGGRDDAHFAQFLASDEEAVEAARTLAAALAAEHGIAE